MRSNPTLDSPPPNRSVEEMKIVYGVSGEGLGHVFEAREIAAALRADGHSVKILTYGERALHLLREFLPTRIEGIHLEFDRHGMSLPATARKNSRCLPFYLRHGRELFREVRTFGPDVFLTAFEPLTTILAHQFSRPLISMDNQNEILHGPRLPGDRGFARHLVRLATRVCTYGASFYIVKTFQRPDLRRQKVFFVSPIIQREIRQLKTTRGDHILVYLTKPNAELLEILRGFPEKFIVYCHGRTGEESNLTFRAPGAHFVQDLAACRAIIATTGFSLIADATYLRKPYFGVPLKKQFEQTHNARILHAAGLGEYAENVTTEALRGFLDRADTYAQKLATRVFDPGEQERTLRQILHRITARGGQHIVI